MKSILDSKPHIETGDQSLKMNKMAKIKVKQVRSSIKRPKNQKRTLEALGLRKIGHVVEHEPVPNILGMIEKVKHLVSIEEA